MRNRQSALLDVDMSGENGLADRLSEVRAAASDCPVVLNASLSTPETCKIDGALLPLTVLANGSAFLERRSIAWLW